MSVTVVLTSCNRPDLLEKTLESFLSTNTYPIKQWIISEDSGKEWVNAALMKKYPDFTWICGKRGQIKSIDEAYSLVTTEYVLHWEEDWLTHADGFIEESIAILKSSKTSAVMLRKYGDGYTMSDTPPFLDSKNGWGYFSFNPGLRSMAYMRFLFPNGFGAIATFDPKNAHTAERAINDYVRDKGFRLALTSRAEGYVSHIGWGRHVEDEPRIGLCMIVKNEAHIIHESMQCTLPLVDTYCIVDTGSTDDTIKIIKDFYGSRNIPGVVYERPWKDFGTNRSEALALCDGRMDYILVIDADDLMSFPPNGKQTLLKHMKTDPNNFMVQIRQGSLEYYRSQIFKANDNWHYKGVLHEYPTNGKPNKTLQLTPEFWMESRRIGGRNKTGDKLQRDIDVLEKGILEEPKNERYVFYLAQSYRDSGNVPKAVEYYKKRVEMGGWVEETYVAAMNVCRLTNEKEWAWKAHEVNPKRIECLVSYMSHCRTTDKWSQELYAMAKYAATIPKPTDQVLFLETDVYDWKVWDELSIISYFTGHPDTAWEASKKLLNNPAVPSHQRDRIRKNSKFGIPKDVILAARKDSTGYYWQGLLSKCSYSGRIVSFLKETILTLDRRASMVITDTDGFVTNDEFESLPPSNKKQVRPESELSMLISKVAEGAVAIVGALATRDVYNRRVIYLPLDDETFQGGLQLGDITPWDERLNAAIWRGNNHGNGIRQKVIDTLKGSMLADVKFVGPDVEWMSIQDQMGYKYIFIIDGTCIASNHQWVFGSGAVPIIVTHPKNNHWFKSHLRAMENYVPIDYDLSNLDAMLKWLVDNDDLARGIAENAKSLADRIFAPEYQKQYLLQELRSIV